VSRARALAGSAVAVVFAALAGGCSVGPDYARPPVITPGAYKENAGWKVAEPRDDVLRGKWWQLFGEPSLDALEEQVSLANQGLQAAEATYRQARALVRQARAAYFPTVTAGVGYARSRQSDTLGNPSGASSSGKGKAVSNQPVSTFQLPIEVAWTPDFWGRVRRAVESGRASAQASAGDLETARLSFQAELAQNYFQLRMLDAQKRLLDDTVAAFATALQLTRNRYASGVASRVGGGSARAGRGGRGGPGVGAADHQPVQGGRRRLPQRDHGADHRAQRPDHRGAAPGPPMVAAVLLIQALDGGWTADELPSPKAASAP